MAKRKVFSFVQAMLLMLVVSIVPLYVNLVYVYQAAYQITSQEVSSSALAQTRSILSDVEREIDHINSRQAECLELLSSRRILLKDASIYSNYEIISAKQSLSEIASIILLNSKMLSGFDFYFPGTGECYTSASGWHSITPEETAYLSELHTVKEGVPVRAADGGWTIYRTNRAYSRPEGYMAGMVVAAKFSEEKIRDMISLYAQSGRDILFVLGDGGRDIMVSTNRDAAARILEMNPAGEGAGGLRRVAVEGRDFLLIQASSEATGITLCQTVLEEAASGPLRQLRVYLALSAGVLALIILLLLGLLNSLFYKPLQSLLRGFSRMEKGDLDVRVAPSRIRELNVIFSEFNKMAKNLNGLIEQQYKQRILAREAELRQLHMQINPHFLYNCFFTLQSMMEEENYEPCLELSHLLGRYLKYSAQNQLSWATLADEVGHVSAYAKIQQRRFYDKVDFSIEPLPAEYASLPAPRLILQPLVENAFEHGIQGRGHVGFVRLRYQKTGSGLRVLVENDGDGLTAERLERIRALAEREPAESGGIALYNIHTRLRLTYGKEKGLRFGVSPLGGLMVSIDFSDGPGASVAETAGEGGEDAQNTGCRR